MGVALKVMGGGSHNFTYEFDLGEYLDILAISCDSFSEETNFTIGRHQGYKNHLNSLILVQNLCQQYKVAFKINTVVNTYNWKEDMSKEILELNPVRWKVCYPLYTHHHITT